MTDVWISWKDTVDPQACNTNPNDYEKVSRDPERTPFLWNNSTSAGFSTNPKTWLPISPDYTDVNVATEELHNGVAMTHLQVFQELKRIREENSMKYGSTKTEALNQNIFMIVRALENSDTFITIMNIWDNVEQVDISSYIDGAAYFEVVSGNSKRHKGEVVNDSAHLEVMPKESFVIRVPSKVLVKLVS